MSNHSTDCYVCEEFNVVSSPQKGFREVVGHKNPETGRKCSLGGVSFDYLMTHQLQCHECGQSETKQLIKPGKYWVRLHRNSDRERCGASQKYFDALNREIKKV